MNKQEELFEKYAEMQEIEYEDEMCIEHLFLTERKYLNIDNFTQAFQNGDLYTKEDVERAKIEAKIQMIDEIIASYENEIKTMAASGIKLYKMVLQKQLKEMK